MYKKLIVACLVAVGCVQYGHGMDKKPLYPDLRTTDEILSVDVLASMTDEQLNAYLDSLGGNPTIRQEQQELINKAQQNKSNNNRAKTSSTPQPDSYVTLVQNKAKALYTYAKHSAHDLYTHYAQPENRAAFKKNCSDNVHHLIGQAKQHPKLVAAVAAVTLVVTYLVKKVCGSSAAKHDDTDSPKIIIINNGVSPDGYTVGIN